LIALSGGSLGLAFGLSGVTTYALEHGHGAADLLRDPRTAVRDYLSTATPLEAVLDLLEFGLTFAPGNFAGAAAGRGVRSVTGELLDDPAAFLSRRQAAIRAGGEVGSVRLPGSRGADEVAEAAAQGLGLDAADLAAIQDYTGPGFRELNPRLRAGGELDAVTQARVDAVSVSLGKLGAHSGTVYRGTQLAPDQLARYEPGTVVREAGFTSTTMDPTRGFRGNVRFVIESVGGRDVSSVSQFPQQAEVLFDRGAAFEVLAQDVDPASGLVQIYLREVTP